MAFRKTDSGKGDFLKAWVKLLDAMTKEKDIRDHKEGGMHYTH